MLDNNIINCRGIVEDSIDDGRRFSKMGDSHVQFGVDTAIASGSILIPIWVYQLSEWAGALATICGFIIILIRLYILIRSLLKK